MKLPALGLALIALAGFAATSSAESIVTDAAATKMRIVDRKSAGPNPKLVLYTTMATWCAPCKAELPQLTYLRSVFKPEELGMFGLPYDDKEGAAKLTAWADANHPPYELVANLTPDGIASAKSIVKTALRMDAVPAIIVTDGDGRIVRVRFGPPSVSELRELLRQRDRR
jgi:cytochrome c biogenesis protein CcmG/thiol:disulfide interchange protein DsbE